MTVPVRETIHPSQSPSDSASYVRLHVTPLDAELLKVVLSSTLQPKARNISYHTIETFLDKRYGFLELPNEDAEKLRKKLNGAVLKGVKIRIERARPSSIPTPLADAAMAKDKSSKKTADGVRPEKDKKSKKRKRGAEVVSGVVLEDGRKIKRGWTTAEEPIKDKRSKKDKEKKSKDKKKQPKSKYTDHAECLVKTVLPPNAAPSTETQPTPTKNKKGKSREVIVHEFEKTTKFPTFLKATAPVGKSSAPLEFVEGKGWVDEEGNVVEAVKTRPPPPARVFIPTDTKKDTTSDEEDSSNSSDDECVAESEPDGPAAVRNESSAPAAAELESRSPSPSPAPKSPPARPRSSASIGSLSVKIPPTTPKEVKVHPLEALYKRSKETDGEAEAAPAAPGFSFFANGDEDNAEDGSASAHGEESGVQMPMTPFTRQDLELRGIRSAAPTPDTAHPHRRFIPWERDEEEDREEADHEGEDVEMDEHIPSTVAAAQDGERDGKPTSDFQKWFWENRGDLNRSWKKRRKMAGKEKRYRENKARMARAI